MAVLNQLAYPAAFGIFLWILSTRDTDPRKLPSKATRQNDSQYKEITETAKPPSNNTQHKEITERYYAEKSSYVESTDNIHKDDDNLHIFVFATRVGA